MSEPKEMPTIEQQKEFFASIEVQNPSILGTAIESLLKSSDSQYTKLSFDVDPQKTSHYDTLFTKKTAQIPNMMLKRIRDTEELIGGVILPVRAKQVSLFARPRANRFDIGYSINFKPIALSTLPKEEQDKWRNKVIPELRDLVLSCGHNDGIMDRKKKTLSQFMIEIIEDGLTFGGFAAEVRKDEDGKFHSFRAVDASTVYFANPKTKESQQAKNVRKEAARILKQLGEDDKIVASLEDDKEYTYVQVIDDVPRQVFTDDQLLYWSLYPSADIYKSGYPISPMERILSAISTHINLTTHNKLFFLNGRAAKNVMVFKSNTLEGRDIEYIKTQMMAHINSANSSHRMPVFKLGLTDEVSIMPLSGEGKDMEFQYLADLNKRLIFAAYQMSPDEVAALSYLSRGTNSQSLSESNNEWKLVAARDTGLRPLLLSIEDFFNTRLLPAINPEWAKYLQINFEGLDADSPEKEATRLQQDSALFLTMNNIMERVEKDSLPIGGDFPLNVGYIEMLKQFFTKGEILKAFGGEKYKDADKNADLQYYMNDPVWLQMQQMKMQQQAMQQQQAQMQAQAPGQPGQAGQPPQEQPQDQQTPEQGQEQPEENQADLNTALGQLSETLGKSEHSAKNRRDLLRKLNRSKKDILKTYEKDSKETLQKVLETLGKSEHDCDTCKE